MNFDNSFLEYLFLFRKAIISLISQALMGKENFVLQISTQYPSMKGYLLQTELGSPPIIAHGYPS